MRDVRETAQPANPRTAVPQTAPNTISPIVRSRSLPTLSLLSNLTEPFMSVKPAGRVFSRQDRALGSLNIQNIHSFYEMRAVGRPFGLFWPARIGCRLWGSMDLRLIGGSKDGVTGKD